VPVNIADIAAQLTKAKLDRLPIEPFSGSEGLTCRPLTLSDDSCARRPARSRCGSSTLLRGASRFRWRERTGSRLSGGLTAAVPLTAGDMVVATADRLGSAELGCV